MDYAIYLILGFIALCAIALYLKRLRAKIKQENLDFLRRTHIETNGDALDDFICIRKSDGSTVSGCRGVTIVMRKE